MPCYQSSVSICPHFSDIGIFPYGGSDFKVSKVAFGKVAPVKIDHMEIVVACKTMSAAFRGVKAEINVMQQVAEHQSFSFNYGIMEPGLILLEFIGTIKSENTIISKAIHTCLGNVLVPKTT